MVMAFIGDAPSIRPVQVEQHKLYGQVYQYVVGRYLISLPEGFEHRGNISSSFQDLVVSEVDWPEAADAQQQRELLWREHIEKLEKQKKRVTRTTSTAKPYYTERRTHINGFPVVSSFYYTHDEPTYVIFNEHRTSVTIHYLVDYTGHGVWFYGEGYLEKQAEIESQLTNLIAQYEPYPNNERATLKPNSYHILRGVINRPLSRFEQFSTAFMRSYQNGFMNLVLKNYFKSEELEEDPNKNMLRRASELSVTVKQTRDRKRQAMNCDGNELVMIMKDSEELFSRFSWWCNEKNYEDNHSFWELFTHVEVPEKNISQSLEEWDFILDNLQLVENQE